MANDTRLNSGTGGDLITTVDLAAFTSYPADGKAPAGVIYVSQNAGTAPTPLTTANPLPISGPVTQSGTWSVTQGGAPWSVSQSGTWTVQQGGAPWSVSQSGAWSVTLNAGVATIGAVTQASGPWTENLTQLGGTVIDTNSGNKSAGTQRVVIATDQPTLGTIGAVTQAAGPWTENQTQIAGTAIDVNSGNKSAGTQRVVLATDQPALSNPMPVSQAVSPWGVNLVPTSGPLLSVFRSIWPGATNGTLVKASAGGVYYLDVSNTGAAIRFIKLYNKATAPTVGTDTPSHTWAIKANDARTIQIPHGISFGTGIGIGVSTGVADTDTGAPGANEVVVNLYFV